jgi:hypothetical protein
MGAWFIRAATKVASRWPTVKVKRRMCLMTKK